MDEIMAAKQQLVGAGRVLQQHGQGDMTRGHVSVRVPGRADLFLMKPHGLGLGEITPDNVLTIDLDGALVEGKGRAHSERFIHSEIFRARPDVMAVIHAHPPHATAFAATGQKLLALSQPGAMFHNALPVFAETIQLIRTPELGRALAQCLGPHHAVLMRGHGVTIAGLSLAQAVVVSLTLEEAARIQLLAVAAGLEDVAFPDADVEKLQRNLLRLEQCEVNFAYLLRMVGA